MDRMQSRPASDFLSSPRPPMFELTYYGTRVALVRRVPVPKGRVISQYTIRCRGMRIPFRHLRRDGQCTLKHKGRYYVLTPTPEFWRRDP